MLRPVFRSIALPLLLFLVGGTCSFCANLGDPSLESLLQKGIDRGYPGIAVLTQSADGRIRSSAAGYSDLEKRSPMRVEDAFHISAAPPESRELVLEVIQ